MNQLLVQEVARAFQIFLKLAYPGGQDTIFPPERRAYCNLQADQSLDDYLPPSPLAQKVCQVINTDQGIFRGYAFRLGSADYKNLKLRIELVDCKGTPTWVYGVDTHDGFSKPGFSLPKDHPDFDGLRELQEKNRQLKGKIEDAWAQAGLITQNIILKNDLAQDPH